MRPADTARIPHTSPAAEPGRPAGASALIAAVARAHGGTALWERLTGLRFTMHARAPLLLLRGLNPFWRRYTIELSTRTPRTILTPFSAHGGRGIYEEDSVRIEHLDGRLIAERQGARAHARDHLLWDDLDLLYLFGYAFWSYHALPFLLGRDDVQSVEIEPWRDHKTGETVRRLQLQLPPSIPSHCADQIFYFDERGLLVRMDYGAEILNPKRRGSQLCEDYRNCGGLMIAMHRYAVPLARGPRAVRMMPTLIEAFLDDVELLGI